MPEKFVYYMSRVNKIYPPQKTVLKEISLSFYYGAKIGIIGVNGSGKSTIMKIMAGIDTEFQGEAWIEPGRTVGYLSQEPQLDESLDVKGNVELAVQSTKNLLREFEEVSAKFGETMSDADMDKLMARQAALQEKIDSINAWELDRQLDIAMDALAPAAGRRRDRGAFGRRAPPRCALQAAPAEAGPPAPRRTHQPPRRRVRGVARTPPARIPGVSDPGHARPLFP